MRQEKVKKTEKVKRPTFPEDAWLNDAKPSTPYISYEDVPTIPLSQIEKPPPTEQTSSNSKAEDSIGPEHPLWSIVLRLSEQIWQELHQLPYTVCRPGPLLTGQVRKRTLDLLRAEPTVARYIHNITDATVLLQSIVNEVVGYGPLTTLLQDECISELMALGSQHMYVERNGQAQEVARCFADDRHMLRIVENLLHSVGQRMPSNWPIIEAHLLNGSLMTVTMPPCAVNGPTITIRKRTKKLLPMTELVEHASLSQEMADFLRACVLARLNIIICGGIGSGRTTLLNALCAYIPTQERVVTIEDVAELSLSQPQLVRMVSRLTCPNKSEQLTARDLVLHAQRMQPDRIIVGECQSDEASMLLQSMYTGHDGTLMTMYAHNVRDCLVRLETLCLSGSTNATVALTRTQIARSLDVVVHLSVLQDGSRKITNIAEVQGVESAGIKIQSIFHYWVDRLDGEKDTTGRGTFLPSGFCPTFLPKFEAMNVQVPCEMLMQQ